MIIKPKPLPNFIRIWGAEAISFILRRRFNKFIIDMPEIKPGHSYLLMVNHFGFIDGPLAVYLTLNGIHKKHPLKGFNIMSLRKQMEKRPWLRRIGSFSVVPWSNSRDESLAYAAEILSTPGNLLLFYPQARIESQYIRTIDFKDGIKSIVPQIKGDCQIIWCSMLTEYFESTKQSVYYKGLDVGTNHDFDFDTVVKKVNEHHRKAIEGNFRYTVEE